MGLSAKKTGSGVIAHAPTVAGQSGANQDILFAQYVSAPMVAHNFGGTIKGQALVAEGLANANRRSQLKVYVISGDATTVRGVLLDLDNSALSNEWAVGGTGTNRKFPLNYAGAGTALTPVNALQGDRLVLEIGCRGTPPDTGSYQSQIRFDESGTAGDLPENETETSTTFNPWIELSDDIAFIPESIITEYEDRSELTTIRQVFPPVAKQIVWEIDTIPSSGIAPPGPAPYIDFLNPPSGQRIPRNQKVSVNIVSPNGNLRTFIEVRYNDLKRTETIYDGQQITEEYRPNSTISTIPEGFAYTLMYKEGWPDDPIITIFSIDLRGREL